MKDCLRRWVVFVVFGILFFDSILICAQCVVNAGVDKFICIGQSAMLSASCSPYTVTATLDGSRVVPSSGSGANGSISGTFNPSNNELKFQLSYANLSSAITEAHLHTGAVGINGAVNFTYSGPNITNNSTFYLLLTSTQAASLMSGNMYFDIHTSNYSEGEIRGQLSVQSPTCATNYVWSPGGLSGQSVQVSPTVSTIYTVTGTNPSTGCTVTSSVTVNVNALPVINTSGDQTICIGNSATLSTICSSKQVNSTLTGEVVVPASGSSASGSVSGTFDPSINRLAFNLMFDNLSLPIQKVSLHLGAAGTNSPAWKLLPVSGDVSGSYNYDLALTNSEASSLLGGNIYIVLSNASFPNGEIRGQLSALTNICTDSFVWSGGATGQTIQVSPTANTGYIVTATNATTGCSNTASVMVQVNPLPAVSVLGAQTVCSGTTATLWAMCASKNVSSSLTGGAVVPANESVASGTVTGSFSALDKRLVFNIGFDNLTSPINKIDIHVGGVGVNGTNIRSYQVAGSDSGSYSYDIILTDVEAMRLLEGNMYVVISDSSYTDGEIRGQLNASEGSCSDSFVWNPGELSGQTVQVNPVATTIYTVTALNSSTGCSNSASVTVSVNQNMLTLDSPIHDIASGTVIHKAIQNITATNKILAPANVVYRAGEALFFNAGFEVANGVVFKTEIAGCAD